MKPRDYQQKAIDMTRERALAMDKAVLIFLATGGGKSIIFKEMIRTIVLAGFNVLFLVKRKDLIRQASNNHFKPLGLKPSVIMGNEKGFKRDAKLQVCSTDTINRRIDKPEYEFLKGFDYVFVDEAHDVIAKKYQEVLDKIKYKLCVGLTATPFQVGRRGHDYWDSCVKPISKKELMQRGYLTDAKTFSPTIIDTSKVRQVAGEFHQGDLYDVVSESAVIGDIVEAWIKYGNNKPTLLFAVNIKHSKLMCEAFKARGITAVHVDKDTTKEEREQVKKDSENGKIMIICSVMVFSTGQDLPWIETGIMARPTKSLILWEQMIGRLLRPYKQCQRCKSFRGAEKECRYCKCTQLSYHKKFATILDHGNNTMRDGDGFGLPFTVREACLKTNPKRLSNKRELELWQCESCSLWNEASDKKCADCGYEKKKPERQIIEKDGVMKLVTEEDYLAMREDEIISRFSYLRDQRRWRKGLNAYEKIFKEYGVDAFKYINFPKELEKTLRHKIILENGGRLYI